MPTLNTPPTAPSGLSALVSGSTVNLSWNAASDAQTPAAGLTYNLRVGSASGGFDFLAPNSNPATGARRLPALGNAQKNLSATLTLPPGRYYWSVQALDAAFAGSPFATEPSFLIPFTPPVISSFAYLNGQFQVRFTGYHSGNYVLEGSTNLLNWSTVATIGAPTNGTYQLADLLLQALPRRFYRVGVH
jgi:hypothetical protein